MIFILIVLLCIVIIIEFIIISLVFSNITVKIEECDISYNENCIKGFYIQKLNISIQLYIFKILKILNIKIYKDYIEIFKLKIRFNIFDKIKSQKNVYESIFRNLKLLKNNKDIINIKNLKPIITNFDLDLSFGTENPIFTIFSIPTISLIISILISNSIYKYDKEKYNYKITPKYLNYNNFSIDLSTTLSFSTLRLLLFVKEYKNALVH